MCALKHGMATLHGEQALQRAIMCHTQLYRLQMSAEPFFSCADYLCHIVGRVGGLLPRTGTTGAECSVQ